MALSLKVDYLSNNRKLDERKKPRRTTRVPPDRAVFGGQEQVTVFGARKTIRS